MKKAITILAVFMTSYAIISCSNSNATTGGKIEVTSTNGAIAAPQVKWDSTYTAVDYVFNYLRNDYRTSTALRGVRSVYKQDPQNPTKNIYVTDSIYIVWVERDSLNAAKKPVLDSAGNAIKKLDPTELPKGLLIRDHQLKLPIPKNK